LDLCGNSVDRLRAEIASYSVSDAETLAEMKSIWERHHYAADPHTAVGVSGWRAYKKTNPEVSQSLVLATAHPAKFAEVVQRAIGEAPQLPQRLAQYLNRAKLSVPMSTNYDDLKSFLWEN